MGDLILGEGGRPRDYGGGVLLPGVRVFGEKMWLRRASLISTVELALGSSGKRGFLQGATNFLACHMLWGVVLARNCALWEFLAYFIPLKFPCLESLARLTKASVRCFLTNLEALAYSLRSVVREGDHPGFDFGEERDTGVWWQITAVRVSRE